MNNRVERVKTDISEPQMAQAIIEAWKDMFGTSPYKEQVSMILAQNNLETGHRKSMYNYNVGNITHTSGDGFDYWTGDDWYYDNKHQKKTITQKFRAYPDLKTGVKDYLNLLKSKHYSGAWDHIIHPDPVAFSKALKAGGYYTEDESKYTAGIKSLFDQANKSHSYEDAVSGKAGSNMVTQDKGLDYLQKLHEKLNPHTKPAKSPSGGQDLMAVITNYLQHIMASEQNNKKLYKSFLPAHNVVIKVNALHYTDAIEFSRILCAALEEELLSKAFIHTDGENVEVECCIRGPQTECFETVQQLTNSLADVFTDATIKIGGLKVKSNFIMNKKSSYQQISLESAINQYRKFLLKFI